MVEHRNVRRRPNAQLEELVEEPFAQLSWEVAQAVGEAVLAGPRRKPEQIAS